MKRNKLQKYLLEGLIGAFLFLFLSWGFGYYANALWGTKFELQSCWAGVGAITGGGVLAAVKYITDSLANSERGCNPYDEPPV